MRKLLFPLILLLLSACTESDSPSKKEEISAEFTFQFQSKNLVQFTSKETNADSYQWEFGDGKTSSEANPLHKYDNNGSYKVTLTVKSANQNVSTSQNLEVSDITKPISQFTYEIKSRGVVEFKSSASFATEHHWDFGDGEKSHAINPTHTFKNNGNYTVSLKVTNEFGEHSSSQNLALTQVLPPEANFTFVIDKGKVSFTNRSANADSFIWDFGDGASSLEYHPVHTYKSNGSYIVKLTAANTFEQHVIEKTVSVTGLGPSTANQTLYLSTFTNKTILEALDASTGELIWARDGYEGRIEGAITAEGNTLYFCTNTHLYAVDASNGNVRWRFNAGSSGSPLVQDGRVYFGSNNHHVYAINASNGNVIWSTPVASAISASVILDNQILYVGTHAPSSGGGGIFYALNASNGSIHWQRGTYGGSMNTKAQISGNYVYFGGSVGIHILNKHQGSGHEGLIAYSFKQIQNSNPIVSDQHIFGVVDGNVFQRIDVINNADIWSVNLGTSDHKASPVLIGNTFYITARSKVLSINKGNGAENWSFNGSNFSSRNVTYANDIVYVTDNKGSSSELLALDAKNGQVIFRTNVQGSSGDITVIGKDGKSWYPGSTGQNP